MKYMTDTKKSIFSGQFKALGNVEELADYAASYVEGATYQEKQWLLEFRYKNLDNCDDFKEQATISGMCNYLHLMGAIFSLPHNAKVLEEKINAHKPDETASSSAWQHIFILTQQHKDMRKNPDA